MAETAPSEDADLDSRTQLDMSISDAVHAVGELVRDRSTATAERACLELRKAVQFFLFVWGDFGPAATSRTGELESALETAELELTTLCQQGSDEIVEHYRENIQHRSEFLKAVIDGDFDTMRRLSDRRQLV